MLRKIKFHIAKELFLCLLSAVLLVLSFPNFNLWIFAWISFLPLLLALENKSKAKAFLLSYLTGVIFWSVTIYWLIHVTLPGMILLVLYVALYFGIFGLIISAISHQPSTINLLFIPSVWVLLEYIRAHLFTGFPWALLGYSQYLNLPIIQIADITGAWGVSFLVMMVNVAIYSVVSHKLSVVSKKFVLFMLFMIFSLAYGYYKLYHLPLTTYHLPLKISVIQGNIPQQLKWDLGSKEFIIDKYFKLTLQVVKDSPDLIIWPEAALPVVLEEEPVYYEKVIDLVKEIKIPLVLGAVTLRDELYYNSALLLSDEGKLLNKYDKLHLVPFGEYIPLRKIFSFLETVVPIGDFTAGKEYTVFSHDPRPTTHDPNYFSVLICFEDLFPELSRGFAKKGAHLLVNITNDAWFAQTSSPYQHLQASVFRAVENRLPLVRAANTGVSGFITAEGKIISLVADSLGRNIFIDGYKTERILIPQPAQSFYTRCGDIFIVGCFLLSLYAIISRLKNK